MKEEKKQKFDKETRTFLSNCAPITRRWAVSLLERGKKTDEVKRTVRIFHVTEVSIYSQWIENAIHDMSRIKLNLSMKEWIEKLSLGDNLDRLLSQARKEYTKSESKALGKFINRVKRLQEKQKEFYKRGTQMLLSGENFVKVIDLAGEIEKENELFLERELYLKQTIKHIERLNKLGVRESYNNIVQALKPEYAGNPAIFDKQVVIACHTYVNGTVDPSTKVKVYRFIEESVQYAGYVHANLIQYLMKQDCNMEQRISHETFLLLEKLCPKIKAYGMTSLVSMKLHPLAKQLKEKEVSQLSESDLYILKLAEMYK